MLGGQVSPPISGGLDVEHPGANTAAVIWATVRTKGLASVFFFRSEAMIAILGLGYSSAEVGEKLMPLGAAEKCRRLLGQRIDRFRVVLQRCLHRALALQHMIEVRSELLLVQ